MHIHSGVNILLAMASNLEDSIACEFCGRSFGRQEHLDRHVRSHLNHRPFRCDGCDQYFSRRDTRNRHAAVSCPKAERPRTRAYSNRATAACVPCSHSKLRCSTGSPCTRCYNKGLVCHYRESKDTGGRSRVLKTLRASSMRSDSSIKNYGMANEQVVPPQDLQETNLETQLLQTSTYGHGHNLPISPESNSLSESSRSEETTWPILELPDLAYLDLLMPFGENSFFCPERVNGIAHLNTDSSDEGIPKSISSQRASIGIENVHSRSVSKSDSAHETHLRFRCGGIVQPFLWRAQCSASPFLDDTPSSIAKINHETESDLQMIGISDKDLLEMDDYAHVPKLKSEDSILQEMFDFICEEQHRVLGTVESEIPDLCDEKAINSFIQLYFEFFHPQFPMLHMSTFHMFNTNWILVLAVVAIGSRYSRVRQARQYASFFGKYLRHAITSLGEDKIQHTLRVPFIQATILSQIIMSYSGTKTLYLQSHFQKNMLATLCRGLGTGLSRGYVTHTIQNRNYDNEPYFKWLGRELAVRAVHCGWLFDCQLNLNCDISAIMSLDGFDIPLPCHEDIWNMTEGEWMGAFQNENLRNIPESPHMHETLAFITHKSNNIPPIGDFSRILVTMAIYQQSRVIMDASFVMTNTTRISCSQSILNHSIYTEWRDSAIVTLGMLSQSSKNPMLSDLYHHLMIIVHIPLKSLCTVAGWTSTEDAILASKKELYLWMTDNPQAARKTLLHGAILFKSLRSRPLNTYREAHELLAATLTIWTYALLHPPRSESTLTGPIIYLDRHMNEDQERSWISYPNEDSPVHISGVGCILNYSAATRVLLEAKVCLSRQSHLWGTYNQIMTVFEVMAASGTAISLD